MKVVHINTERGWRGGERQSWLLIQGLTAKGVENWTVSRAGGEWGRRCVEAGAKDFPVTPLGEWDPFTAHTLNRFLQKIQPDVIHAHTGHGAGLGAFSTLGLSTPLVVHRRVDFHLSSNPFSRWKMKRAKKVIAISAGVKKVLLEDGVPEGKIALIPSGVDLTSLENLPRLSPSELGLPEGVPVVGQIAALADHKDQVTLVRAAALVNQKRPEVQFVIIGEGEERTRLETLIKKEKLEKTFHLAGFLDRPERFLKSFSVFCLSSKLEGLGTAVLDAMASRVPVVATRAGGIPEMVEDGKTGILAEPRDPASLAEALLKGLEPGPEREKRVEKAFQKAKIFDISSTVDRTLALYKSLK